MLGFHDGLLSNQNTTTRYQLKLLHLNTVHILKEVGQVVVIPVFVLGMHPKPMISIISRGFSLARSNKNSLRYKYFPDFGNIFITTSYSFDGILLSLRNRTTIVNPQIMFDELDGNAS